MGLGVDETFAIPDFIAHADAMAVEMACLFDDHVIRRRTHILLPVDRAGVVQKADIVLPHGMTMWECATGRFDFEQAARGITKPYCTRNFALQCSTEDCTALQRNPVGACQL
jgi:hypothetical protein